MMKFSTCIEIGLPCRRALFSRRLHAPSRKPRRHRAAAGRRRQTQRLRPSPRASCRAAPRIFRVNVGDTVHFAYNEYNIEDATRAMLQRQAAWLAQISVRPRHHRRSLRRARHARIQPRAGRAPRQCGEGISGQPGRLRRPASRPSPTARNVRSAPSRTRIAGRRTAAASPSSPAARTRNAVPMDLRRRARCGSQSPRPFSVCSNGISRRP